MMNGKTIGRFAGVPVLVAVVACGVWWLTRPEDGGPVRETGKADATSPAVSRDVPSAPQATDSVSLAREKQETDEEDDETPPEEPQTEEEKREAQEEKLVEDFDNLTDAWMEPSKNGVSMSDVDKFAAAFRKIPKSRQDECVHRALNLIPDENVMLLAGILMDKGNDQGIVETVYNDILNRDETVKKPILKQIFSDKTHPCWADTAWILDVTDELPNKKQ